VSLKPGAPTGAGSTKAQLESLSGMAKAEAGEWVAEINDRQDGYFLTGENPPRCLAGNFW